MTTDPSMMCRNPRARVRLDRPAEGPPRIVLACPVKGRGLLASQLAFPDEERVLRLYRRLFRDESPPPAALSDAERAFLAGLGYLVRPDQIPAALPLDEALLAAPLDEASAGPFLELHRDRLRARGAGSAPGAPHPILDRARRELAETGGAGVPAVLGPALLEVAQARLHGLLGEGYLHHEPADRHHTAFDEPLGEALHRHLTPLVAAVVGRALVPSYCYLTHYLQGAVLPPHTDNSQCEVSLAVTLLATPDPEAAQDWPLCLHPEGHPARRIVLLPGDGLIFYGRDLVHSRAGALAAGRTLTSLLLHFVDPVTYRGPLKRPDHV